MVATIHTSDTNIIINRMPLAAKNIFVVALKGLYVLLIPDIYYL